MLLCDNIENELNILRDDNIITNIDKEQMQIVYEDLRTNIQLDDNSMYEELDKNITIKSLIDDDSSLLRTVFKKENNIYKFFRFNIRLKINGEEIEIYTECSRLLCLIMKEIYFQKLAYDKSKTTRNILVPKIHDYGIYVYNNQKYIGIYIKMEYISALRIDVTDYNSKILYMKQVYKLLKKVRKFFIDNNFYKNDCGYVYNYINKLLITTTNKIDYLIEHPLFINKDLFQTLFGEHNNVYLHSNIHVVLIDFETASRLEEYNQILCSSKYVSNIVESITL